MGSRLFKQVTCIWFCPKFVQFICTVTAPLWWSLQPSCASTIHRSADGCGKESFTPRVATVANDWAIHGSFNMATKDQLFNKNVADCSELQGAGRGAGHQYSSQKMWRRQLSGCVAVSSGSVWFCGGLLGTSCTRTHRVLMEREHASSLHWHAALSWAVSQHTDTSKNTKALCVCVSASLSLSLSLSQINCFLTHSH